MQDAKPKQFRERFSELGEGLKYEPPSARRRPSTEGLKLDMSFDVSRLGKFGEGKAEIGSREGSVVEEGAGLRIDADLAKIKEGLENMRRRDQDERVAKILEEAQDLISKGDLDKALAKIERALKLNSRPASALLLKGHCLYLLHRYEEAMTVLAEARTNAEGPQIVLLVLLLQAACERAKAEPEIEKVRLLLRRGQREAAAQRIEALAAVLGNDGRVQAIRAYLFELKPRGLLEFLFTRGERLQDGQRQQLLQWLLSEEIARGVKALKAKNYDEAKNVFDRAAQIDDRCAVVCFLFGRTVYEGIDAASEQGASTDLATHQADLTKAIRMVRSAVRDREVGKQCKLLLRVLSSRSEQIAEVRLEIARMERQARPVNQLIQRFNILMESLEHTGIGCTSDLTRAADEFRQIHRAATLLIRKGGVSPQGKDALTRLAGAAERHERELNAVREQMEARECMEQFRNLMDKYQKSPISTPDEHRQAVIAFLELWDKTRKVRAGSTDKEGVMGKLEEAIEKILKQLAA